MNRLKYQNALILTALCAVISVACNSNIKKHLPIQSIPDTLDYTAPIITIRYSADPSARVFNDTLYLYPSHDKDNAQWWDMEDYYVYSTTDLKTFKDEGISAKNMDRPALQELLAYCMDETNEVEAVIVWKLDRISRNVADYTATLSPFFAQNNIQLLTVTDINGEGLDVEMMRQISMVFAERERKMTALRTKEGIRGKVALGQYPYHAPVGYENIEVKGSKYKKMVIDEENAFFVRQAYNLCLQGDSIVTITQKLYNMGFRNKHGNIAEIIKLILAACVGALAEKIIDLLF